MVTIDFTRQSRRLGVGLGALSALMLVLHVVGCATGSAARRPRSRTAVGTPVIAVSVEAEGSDAWVNGRRCAERCDASLPAGEVETGVSEHRASAPSHRHTFTLTEPTTVRYAARDSRHEVRVAGGVTLLVGWLAAIGVAAGIGVRLGDEEPAFGLLVGVPSGLAVGLVFSIVGGSLLGVGDEVAGPTYHHGPGRAPPGPPTGPGPVIVPTVSASGNGATVGVVGTF